jgi:hypothetical protein
MRRVQIEKITKRAPESVCASAEDHHGRGCYSSKRTAGHDLLCNTSGLYIYEFVFGSEAEGAAKAEKEGRV